MDLTKFPSFLERIIYDPIRGRLFYDFLASLVSDILAIILFWFFVSKSIIILPLLLYPILFIFFCFIFGLYGRNKTAILNKRILIIFFSNLIAYFLLILYTNEYFLLTITLIISTIVTTLPRFFLNFNVERISFKKIGSNNSTGPILIVGGGGYIGSMLTEELLKKGEKVKIFDKFIYGQDVFKDIKNSKNLELLQGDISDIYKLTLAVKDSRAIVHLAGIVGDPAANIDEKLTRHVNIASTRMLKETAKAFNVKRFIFASSCSVYGFSNSMLNEKSKCKPISLYAKTKLDSEKELLSDTADTFHPVILRFATVFGHSRKPRFDLVANLFVAEAYYNKKIIVYGGNQWRPFIHVKDIAYAIIKVLEAPEDLVSRQIFNVGDNNMNTQINTLAEIVRSASNNPKTKIEFISKNKDKRNYKVSFKKIQNDLEFNTSISLGKGIREIFRNFKNNKYKKKYKNSFYVNSEMTKTLKKEFQSKKYKKSHFSTIS